MKKIPPQIFLTIVAVAALGPFVDKAFHIDDPLFLWMADQITRHPLDPYGFQVNWIGAPEPMWSAMQNPPLCSYFIAGISAIVGQSEMALHMTFVLWAILVALGAFALTRHFSDRALVVALLTLFTPVFLVSATNVMCDVMLVALYTWAIERWVAALERQRWWLFASSTLLICAAAFTKYFGVSLVGLLGAYTLFRDWRSWTRLIWLIPPVLLMVFYDWWSRQKYGVGLFIGAAHYANVTSARYAISIPKQFLLGCSFFGGCFFTALFFTPFKRRNIVVALLAFAIAMTCFRFVFPPGREFDGNYVFVLVEGGLFVATAWVTVGYCLSETWRRRDAVSFLAILWVLGTFAFATFLNWSVTARTMLPAAPAIAIFMMMRFEREGTKLSTRTVAPLVLAAVVSLAVTLADYRAANTARDASHQFQRRFKSEPGTVWFQSHWGFQFYMQRWGARPLNLLGSMVTSGDVMIVPANNTAVISIPPEKVYEPEKVNFDTVPFVSTAGFETGASFYSSVRGPLPWMCGRVPPEMYYVARFR